MAQEWYSKKVPMQDITRLLEMSEQEVLSLLEEGDAMVGEPMRTPVAD